MILPCLQKPHHMWMALSPRLRGFDNWKQYGNLNKWSLITIRLMCSYAGSEIITHGHPYKQACCCCKNSNRCSCYKCDDKTDVTYSIRWNIHELDIPRSDFVMEDTICQRFNRRQRRSACCSLTGRPNMSEYDRYHSLLREAT